MPRRNTWDDWTIDVAKDFRKNFKEVHENEDVLFHSCLYQTMKYVMQKRSAGNFKFLIYKLNFN